MAFRICTGPVGGYGAMPMYGGYDIMLPSGILTGLAKREADRDARIAAGCDEVDDLLDELKSLLDKVTPHTGLLTAAEKTVYDGSVITHTGISKRTGTAKTSAKKCVSREIRLFTEQVYNLPKIQAAIAAARAPAPAPAPAPAGGLPLLIARPAGLSRHPAAAAAAAAAPAPAGGLPRLIARPASLPRRP